MKIYTFSMDQKESSTLTRIRDVDRGNTNIKTVGIKQRQCWKTIPEKIVIEADNKVFFSDYYYMKFNSKEYTTFKIRVLFGSFDIKNPFEGLKATLDQFQNIKKETRSRQKKQSFSLKVRFNFISNFILIKL